MTSIRVRFGFAALLAPLAFVGSSDGWQTRRDKIARLSAAERTRLEERRQEFERLPVIRQRELRDLAAELDAKPAAERSALEADMRQLAAFVDSMPEELRKRYHEAALDSERLNVLKRHRAELDKRSATLAAQMPALSEKARKFANAARMLNPGKQPGGKGADLRPRQLLQQLGPLHGDDEELRRAADYAEASPIDQVLIFRCLAERHFARDEIPFASFANFGQREQLLNRVFQPIARDVPALKSRASADLSTKERTAYWNAVAEIYLLSPRAPKFGMGKKFKTKEERQKPPDLGKPTLLTTQVETLRAYLESPAKIPSVDRPRVEKLTGKK